MHNGTSLTLEKLRGKANEELTAEMALRLGQAAGLMLQAEVLAPDPAPRVLIGKDTRLPNYMLEQALTAGLVSTGAEVLLTGPLPTAAVALLTRSMRADLGVMIGGSKETFEHSGFALFEAYGNALDGKQKSKIEGLLQVDLQKKIAKLQPGRARRIAGAAERYIEIVKRTLPRDLTLEGSRVVVDCGHGASYLVAPKVLWELGAEVVPLGVAPNGFNINQGVGSAWPHAMLSKLLEMRADFGITLDGAGEEVFFAAKSGKLLDRALWHHAPQEWQEDGFVCALHALSGLVAKK